MEEAGPEREAPRVSARVANEPEPIPKRAEPPTPDFFTIVKELTGAENNGANLTEKAGNYNHDPHCSREGAQTQRTFVASPGSKFCHKAQTTCPIRQLRGGRTC